MCYPFFIEKMKKREKKMDLGNLVSYDDSIEFELKHPRNEEPIGVTFNLRHKDNTNGRSLVKRNYKNVVKRNGKDIDVDAVLDGAEDVLLSCITGWSWGDVKLHGVENPAFNPENVKKALDIPWIKEQVEAEVNNLENFIKG